VGTSAPDGTVALENEAPGIRPSDRVGWSAIAQSWLRMRADAGGLPDLIAYVCGPLNAGGYQTGNCVVMETPPGLSHVGNCHLRGIKDKIRVVLTTLSRLTR